MGWKSRKRKRGTPSEKRPNPKSTNAARQERKERASMREAARRAQYARAEVVADVLPPLPVPAEPVRQGSKLRF